ncbi:hypothetical protein ABIE45_004538 [Methylobacterium sp. OAE515]|uniref:phage tail tube protein n=1 Tax=Methylobacterium sp. OAE515 TaxID=2817895 RepID=UPI001789D91D
MANRRFAGTTSIVADGVQLDVRSNVTVSLSKVERTGIAGLDGTHGYEEKPRVQFIECDVSTTQGFSAEALEAITDATVTATTASGKTYSLFEAWTKSAFEINTEQGMVRVRFEGMSGSEF